MTHSIRWLLAISVLFAAASCGPAEEMPEPVDAVPTEREDPGSVPENDPDTPDEPGDPLHSSRL